jgi:acyl carrier protein
MVADHNVLDKIREIIADVTHTSIDDVDERTSCETMDLWDSVAQINVIIAIESEFGVLFNVEEMYSLNSVQKLRRAIERAAERPVSE